MVRSDLILAIAEERLLSIDVATVVVDTFFGSIANRLAVGDRVELRGFGTFSLREYAPAVVRNPKTGATRSKFDRKRLYFRMSPLLLKQLNPNPPTSKKTNEARQRPGSSRRSST